jgi:hypothetical protein
MRSGSTIITLIALVTYGCSAFGEAARDRLGAKLAGRKPSLQLRCETPSAAPGPPEAVVSPARLMVRGGSDPGRPAVVGELFTWGTLPGRETPIVLAGSANDVLAADVKRILLRNGFTLTEDAQAASAVLDTAIAGLDVKGVPGQLTDMKGTIRARAAFHAALTRDATVVWKGYFEGDDEMRVAYFLTSDSERTLGRAYCRALDWFEEAVRAPTLRGAMAP